ncbi:MAG: helix-turn-helix domain-containing protein [Actinomycetota bacterium]
MNADPEARSSCPVAASLDILGDRWTLVLLRDVLIGRRSRFAEFAVDEGIATNVLADRLQRLTDAGLLAKDRDPEDGRRWVYRPKQPAVDLIPVLVDLMVWGSENTHGNAPPEILEGVRSDRQRLVEQLTAQASANLAD